MTILLRPVALFALTTCLSGCGDHLGTYTLEDVTLVRQLPQNDTLNWPALPYPEFLRIELSSEANLNTANTGPGLYTDADFCPLRDSNHLIAFEPIGTDERSVQDYAGVRKLVSDPRDGRFHYFVYVVPSSARRKPYTNSSENIPAYDLRRQKQDICLRFFVPGYNVITSRSDTIRIPAQVLARALNQSSSS
jgi:hypothetical protein